MVKHFIKTFLLFSLMILVGLLGAYLVDRFDKSGESKKLPSGVTNVIDSILPF